MDKTPEKDQSKSKTLHPSHPTCIQRLTSFLFSCGEKRTTCEKRDGGTSSGIKGRRKDSVSQSLNAKNAATCVCHQIFNPHLPVIQIVALVMRLNFRGDKQCLCYEGTSRSEKDKQHCTKEIIMQRHCWIRVWVKEGTLKKRFQLLNNPQNQDTHHLPQSFSREEKRGTGKDSSITQRGNT